MDTDGDGLKDYDEINKCGTDPNDADTDGDGMNDGDEVDLGFDPKNPLNNLFLTLLIVIAIISIITIISLYNSRNKLILIAKNIKNKRERKKQIRKITIPFIEEKIKQGENLCNTARKSFDSAIKVFQDQLFNDSLYIFEEQLGNVKYISEIPKRVKLREKILGYILYTKILKIKCIIISFCSQYSRLEVIEIVKKSGAEEKIIIQTINEMIEYKEINAEYLSATKSILFNKKPTNFELIDIMKPYEEWEKEGKDKKF